MKLIFNFNWRLINQLPSKLQERYLEYFSGDGDWDIRRHIAQNPNTPSHILETLSCDEDWWTRANVANHPNTPIHVLEKLGEDEDFMVRNNATVNLEKRK